MCWVARYQIRFATCLRFSDVSVVPNARSLMDGFHHRQTVHQVRATLSEYLRNLAACAAPLHHEWVPSNNVTPVLQRRCQLACTAGHTEASHGGLTQHTHPPLTTGGDLLRLTA